MDWLPDVDWWKWGFWLLTTVGVGGLIAIAAIYPAAIAIIGRVLRAVLSTRIGCAVVAAIVAAVIADYVRHSSDDADYAERVAQFEKAQKLRDATIAHDTREEVWKEIADATAANTIVDTNVKDFKDELPPPPATGNVFLIGDVDATRLCQIAGQSGCGSASDRRVQAPRGTGSAHPADPRRRFPRVVSRSTGGAPKGTRGQAPASKVR